MIIWKNACTYAVSIFNKSFCFCVVIKICHNIYYVKEIEILIIINERLLVDFKLGRVLYTIHMAFLFLWTSLRIDISYLIANIDLRFNIFLKSLDIKKTSIDVFCF